VSATVPPMARPESANRRPACRSVGLARIGVVFVVKVLWSRTEDRFSRPDSGTRNCGGNRLNSEFERGAQYDECSSRTVKMGWLCASRIMTRVTPTAIESHWGKITGGFCRVRRDTSCGCLRMANVILLPKMPDRPQSSQSMRS